MRFVTSKLAAICRFMSLSVGFLFVFTTISAQVKITGKVTNANSGNAVQGGTVSVKGTTTATGTDHEGVYILNANLKPGNVTLVFSSVGLKTVERVLQITSTSDYTLNAELNDDVLGLDEVVVIGSTISQSKKQLGNTISTINKTQLANTGTANLGGALQGKVPGAQITQTSGDPAGGISIRMRGTSSLLGSSEPLYVIDGVIMSNNSTNVTNLNVDAGSTSAIGTNRSVDINPADIERMEVINGAAAAAIYGSRAANGVVLITTKKGVSGRVKVDFQTSVNMNELRKKVYITKDPEQFGSEALRLYTIANNTAGANTVTVLGRNLATNKVPVTRYDYQDNVFRKGYGTDNYISMSGGSDKTKGFLSASYMYNQGIVKNADFRRYTLRGRVEHQFADWASMSLGTAYSNSFSNEKPNGNVFWSPINSINITNNIYDITRRDANGNLMAAEPTRINPLSAIETFDIRQEVNRSISDLQVNLRPFKGFKLDYILGFDAYSQEGNIFIPIYPYSGVNPAFFDKGYAGQGFVNSFLLNSDINASYQTKLGENFTSNTVAGYSLQFTKTTSLIAAGRDMQVGVNTVNGAATPLTGSGNNQQIRYLLQGGFLQQTFGIYNQLFLTGAIRVDGSSAFGEKNRRQYFPKVSAAYVLSDGNYWKNSSVNNWFNAAKIRFSYGQSGNLSGVGAYARFGLMTPGTINGVATYNYSSVLGNPDIAIEKHREYEGGADLGFWNNRVGLSFTYYNKRIVDGTLLVNRTVAPSQGGSSITQNIGTVENKGWESALTVKAVKNQDFSYTAGILVSHNKNKVIDAGPGLITLDNATGAPAVVMTGQPLGVFYGTYFATDANGAQALDSRGIPLQAFNSSNQPLRKVIGNPNPDYVFSFNNDLRYKNFLLNVLLDGVNGVQVFNADKRTRQGVGIGDYAEKELKGTIPRGYIWGIYNIEEWRIDDGSFVKLRQVSLTYQLPKIKMFSAASVSLVGRNLISWDKYNGYDPETNAGGNSNVLRGIDFGNVPAPRTYQLVLKASF